MARSRRGRRSNIGKKLYPWQSKPTPRSEEYIVRYGDKQRKKENIVSRLHLADSRNDFSTYMLIAEFFDLDVEHLSKDKLKESVWNECTEISSRDLDNLYNKLNPSYDK